MNLFLSPFSTQKFFNLAWFRNVNVASAFSVLNLNLRVQNSLTSLLEFAIERISFLKSWVGLKSLRWYL